MNKLTIVITGSTRGIGYGLASEFLSRGHRVVLNGRKAERLEPVLQGFREQGKEVEGVPGDVCTEGTFSKLIEKAREGFGGIDIWINNAGIPQSHLFFEELEPCEIRNLVEVNITSTLTGTREAIRFFREQGHGLVLNMEGFGSKGRMMDKLSLYGTTKRAVNYFTKSVAREVKDSRIRVGIIAPGMVRTDFLEHSSSAADPEEQKRNQRVFDILAEDPCVVCPILVDKILRNSKHYPRIEFLTFRRLFPRILKLMFMKK